MKKIFVLVIINLIVLSLFSQEYRKVENTAFKRGERFVFRAYYESAITGKVIAGEGILEVKQDVKEIGGRKTYRVEGTARSKGAFNWFFKVNDRFESYIDEEALIPWLFVRRTREGGYVKDDDVTFIHNKKIAVSRTATKPIPENVQDMISVFYWARNLDISNFKDEQSSSFDFFLDDTTYKSKLVYKGKENITTILGKFKTIKLMPGVAKGNVFNKEHPFELWVSDDKNRIPLLAQSKIRVGKVKLELVSYSNLANPLTSKIE